MKKLPKVLKEEKGSISLVELLWMTMVFVIASAIIVQLTVAVTGMQWAHVYSRNHGMISVEPHEFNFELISKDTVYLISNLIEGLGSLDLSSISSALSSLGEAIAKALFPYEPHKDMEPDPDGKKEGVGDASKEVQVPVFIPVFGVEEIQSSEGSENCSCKCVKGKCICLNKCIGDNRRVWGYYGILVGK